MCGGGVLGIPHALAQSGWLGVFVLCLVGIVCNITANLLGEVMRGSVDLKECAVLLL